ncbi:helix-turn-helix transcriptional regulator [Actinoplanes couchii]|uniref:Transcriptional regulator n=1 Tax=Actinoplanes couchii TaxID=403638 RepID=A0ABQ3WZH9_9ACTN|nr:helix-turn-helix transcriptional regulator [Actinoplanes couchii]MDR6316067.1 transcriptional regulator with XRE-family HTH domain [Actinoplanes couchii]GID51682.1 transcriptional regulator [Actinoplanes couchii]
MTDETGPGELGDFLRSRRARVSPEQAGITSYGRRRVEGLRREELAQLAGVSATYYTRLEQGQSSNASASVIDAIARALHLDDDERGHLHDLARPRRARRPRPARPETAPPGLRQLLAAMTGVAAIVVGRRTEVLAWNPLGHALLAGHTDVAAPDRPVDRPNLTRMLFLDPHTEELYVRRPEEVARAIASLRLVAGRHPDDPELASLVGELTMRSAEFAAAWSRHPVRTCTSGSKLFRHPEVGDLELAFEVLHLPGDAGQRLITYTAAPGSPSEAALRLLEVTGALSGPRRGGSRRGDGQRVDGRAAE